MVQTCSHCAGGRPGGMIFGYIGCIKVDLPECSRCGLPTVELSYRQPFTGRRTIQFHGVLKPGANRRWRAEALNGFEGDPDRENDERGCVDECSKDTGALIAKSFPLGSWSRLKVDSDEGEHDSQ